ncbi:MAG: hypothetical protein AAFU73_03770 [Planctomycetota bacterium]
MSAIRRIERSAGICIRPLVLALSASMFGACVHVDLDKPPIEALKVRRSLTDKNGSSSPAVAQITDPAGEDRVYRVDAGVGWTGRVESDWTDGDLVLGVEAHKNTVIDEEQDNFSVKAVYDENRNIKGFEPIVDILTPTYSLAYVRDLEAGTESVVPSVEWRLVDPELRLGYVISSPGEGDALRNAIEPNLAVGVHHQSILEAENDATGGVTRAYADAAVVYYPGTVRQRGGETGVLGPDDEDYVYNIRFRASYRFWRDIDEGSRVETGIDSYQLFRFAVELALTPDQHWGIALQYQNGEDPIEGLVAQEFVSLGLTAKF